MKANETKVEDFLSYNKTQFVIPVYQRNYEWTSVQCKQLLDDILEVGFNEKMDAHFIGSIVYVHDDVYTSSRIKELTIIDGQQRLTTLTLIYMAIYKLARKLEDEALENEILEVFLINKFAKEGNKLKLRPTEENDKALKYLLRDDNNEEYLEYSRLIDNFNYFVTRITSENYTYVQAGLGKLMFVEISLDREKDNPQRIFESLNSTGLELTQADLIRNYILMGLKRDKQLKIYNNYWVVIEQLARDERNNKNKVSDFIRDFFTLRNKRIPNRRKVYQEFKLNYAFNSFKELESNLRELKSLARHYNKLINPANEKDKDIRLQLEYINRLEINVAYPFLMKVYEDFAKDIITKEIFIAVLNLIQAYTWRRFIVGFGTEGRNKIFMTLYDKIKSHKNYLSDIEKALVKLKGSGKFPKDKEVVEALKTKDIYNIKSKNRTYLLERLENHNNRELVTIEGNPDITVEHIFPQNPDGKWKIDLGAKEYEYIKDNYLHTIGNITLSGNNSALGNRPFVYKRDLENKGYKDSRLWLNKYLSEIEEWTSKEVEQRFKILAERFVTIWKYPQVSFEDEAVSEEVNIFQAEPPKHKKLEYAIFLDHKIKVRQVSKLYVEIIRQLFDLSPETFFTSDLAEKLSLTKNPESIKLRQPTPINETYFIESNMDSIGKFQKIKQALTVFGFEDELAIKYEG